MIDIVTLHKAWSLLDAREHRHAWITLAFVVVSALSSAVMVGSVLPFLTVLSDPNKIEQVPALAATYNFFGFEDEYTFLSALGAASFAIILTSSILQILKTYVLERFCMMRIHALSHRLLIAYLRQPYPFFLSRHTGEMSTRVLAESEKLVLHFLRPASESVAAFLTIIAIVGMIIWVDPVIAVSSFGVLGSIYCGIFFFSRRLFKAYGLKRAMSNSERYRIVNEAFGGIKDIKLLGREASYTDIYSESSQRMARSIVGTQVSSQAPHFALQAFAFGGVIVLCLVLMDADGLASGAALGDILPTLGVFAFAGQRLIPELGKLYYSLAQLQAGAAAVDLVYDDLMVAAKSGCLNRFAPPPLHLKKNLELQGVSYSYPNADAVGLKEVSIDIQAGDRVGIVGSTGSGKTTLADIILGLLSPSSGRLKVDGLEITTNNLRNWQQSLGYVPQDIFLTDASVMENIALGVPPSEIDIHRVGHAAEIAQIAEFIREELPNTYATTVGERGVRLSGGQRQRVGIARAMYHDADLIVFDEATSALDNLTEREVMTAIDALPGHKTVLMIAHRLSSVKKCDRIIVLKKGRLVGYDTWDALMESNSEFQKIARLTDVS